MSYSSDLAGEQWALLEPVFGAPGRRGPRHAPDLRRVVDAMLYVSYRGCQWRYLPESFGPWTRVWSPLRRWSRNGTWTRALTVLHAAAREAGGRADATASMVVIDTHLACGASNGGFTVHDRGGPYGATKAVKRVVAVDVTGLPVGALVVPASTHENRAREVMLEHLTQQGVTGRLELVLVDRGVTAAAARMLHVRHGRGPERGRDASATGTGPPRLRRRVRAVPPPARVQGHLYGTQVVVADRWFPSSKTCSRCGTINANLRLSGRVYDCGHCGLVIDRDANAAVNLAHYTPPPPKAAQPPKAPPLPAAALTRVPRLHPDEPGQEPTATSRHEGALGRNQHPTTRKVGRRLEGNHEPLPVSGGGQGKPVSPE